MSFIGILCGRPTNSSLYGKRNKTMHLIIKKNPKNSTILCVGLLQKIPTKAINVSNLTMVKIQVVNSFGQDCALVVPPFTMDYWRASAAGRTGMDVLLEWGCCTGIKFLISEISSWMCSLFLWCKLLFQLRYLKSDRLVVLRWNYMTYFQAVLTGNKHCSASVMRTYCDEILTKWH